MHEKKLKFIQSYKKKLQTYYNKQNNNNIYNSVIKIENIDM